MPDVAITRQQLKDATLAALRITTDEELVPVPDELRDAVLRVAATAPRVTLSWWSEQGKCGCLIGSIYGPDVIARLGDADTDTALSKAECHIGGNFPVALHRLGLIRGNVGWTEPIAVVENAN